MNRIELDKEQEAFLPNFEEPPPADVWDKQSARRALDDLFRNAQQYTSSDDFRQLIKFIARFSKRAAVMSESRLKSYGVLLLRLALGTMFIAHSVIYMTVALTLAGTVDFFASLGLPPWFAYATIRTTGT